MSAPTWSLYLIAPRPSDGQRHIDPDSAAARVLAEGLLTREETVARGRSYLRTHPGAWLQIEGSDGTIEDVRGAS